MTRGNGLFETIQTTFPDWFLILLAFLTNLGDVVVFVPVLTMVYWFGDRDRGVTLIAVALGGVGLLLLVKNLFAVPRPPTSPPVPLEEVPALLRPIYEGEVRADGYGFPSGHATAATVVWGSLAWWLDVGSRRRRIAAAAGLVVLVSFTRVALGVHYLVDVVAGVALGLAYLSAVGWLRGRFPREPRIFLLVALGLTAAGGLFQGGQDGWLALGAILGASIGWFLADAPAKPWPRTRSTVVRAVVCFGLVVGVAGAIGGLVSLAGVPADPTLGFVTLVTVTGLLALPGIGPFARWIEPPAVGGEE